MTQLHLASNDRKEALKRELEKVSIQVSYYEALTADMKKEINAPKLSHLLSSLSGL